MIKSINSLALSYLCSPTLTSIHDYWKTIALTRRTFVGKVTSLLFNMLSRLVIAFLPRSKHLNFKIFGAPKNVVLLEKTLESPLDCKEIQPVHPKGNQSWIFIGRTEAEAETPILWPPDVKNWLIGKRPDAGKDWRWEEKGMTEDEMVGWYHWLDAHEFEYAPGFGDGQGSLACCSPRSRKETDMTEWLNWTKPKSWSVWLLLLFGSILAEAHILTRHKYQILDSKVSDSKVLQ